MSEWVLMKADATPLVPATPGVSRMFFTRAEIGSAGLTTGVTRFEPGTGLFWHIHTVDESITILEGEPTVEVGGAGRPVESAKLKRLDTVFIPAYTPHRFINRESEPGAIFWSYPVGKIERYRVDPDGTRPSDLAPGEPEAPSRG